jgi:hypothetical protein
MPLILDENQSSTGFFTLFHDSWNAFPLFVLIDHTMTVRAKPWTLENNSNSSSCDGSENTINNWTGGSTNDFIQQLVDECGELCIEDNCPTSGTGDTNADGFINVIDIVEIVDGILNHGFTDECVQSSADYNSDGTVNVIDIVEIVELILGN